VTALDTPTSGAPAPGTPVPDTAVQARPSLAARVASGAAGGALRVFLLLVALFWLVPTLGLLVSSFREPTDIAGSGWWKVFSAPAQLTAKSYKSLLENDDITNSLFNTIWITVPATLLVILVGAMAGYAFAWMDFKGRDYWFMVVVGLLVVPVQVALIPLSGLFRDLGIFGDIIGVILFHAGFGLPFAIFLLRNFFAEIPRELLEAARLDGAGWWNRLTRIIIPLLVPTIAYFVLTNVIWIFVGLFALVYTVTKGGPGYATTPFDLMIYRKAFESGDLGYASALSVVLFLIVLAISAFQLRMFDRLTTDV
jgi:ABC-type glycerol-3-phosphate transport system permease component